MKIDKQIAMQSSPFFGYLILKVLQKKQNCTMYDLYDAINKKHTINSRQLTIGLLYLFSIGLINISEANIWLVK
jgi:hypothetical protein